MATLRSGKSYASFAKGGGSLSSQSSYAQTLAKRMNAAQDDYIDNQYQTGQISASDYLSRLNERTLLRTYYTPLQKENLRQKIVDVREDFNDSQIETGYRLGEFTTTQVRDYYDEKIEKLTPGSTRYNSLLTKVSALDEKIVAEKDKAERDSRSQFRIKENLRISQMPEDNSDRLLEKARLYEQLENQARLDGDDDSADVYATSKNNYYSSARRGEVSDIITSARQTVSETETQGRGVPTTEEGATTYQRLTGKTVPGFVPTPGPTQQQLQQIKLGDARIAQGDASVKAQNEKIADIDKKIKEADRKGDKMAAISLRGQLKDLASGKASSGKVQASVSQSPEVKSSLKTLSRQEKSLQNLYGRQGDKQTQIQTLETALKKSTDPDQKASIQIALNNSKNELGNINNEIEKTNSSVEEQILKIEKAQADFTKSETNRDVALSNSDYKSAVKQLDNDFATGRLNKQGYVGKMADLVQRRRDFLEEVTGAYANIGEYETMQKYVDELSDFEDNKYSQVKDIVERINDYEGIRIDKGKDRGKVALQDVRLLKDNKEFLNNYLPSSGVFNKIHFPGLTTEEGKPLSKAAVEAYSREKGDAFVYSPDGKSKVNVKFVTFKDYSKDKKGVEYLRALPSSEIDKYAKSIDKSGRITKIDPASPYQLTPSGTLYLREGGQQPSGFLKGAAALQQALGIKSGGNVIERILSPLTPPAFFKKEEKKKTESKGFFEIAKNLIFPEVQASQLREGDIKKLSKQTIQTKGSVQNFGKYSNDIQAAAKKYGIDPRLIYATIQTESGGNPNATRYEPHLDESSYGLGQILESTARGLGYTGSAEGLKNPRMNIDLTAKYIKQGINQGAKTPEQVATFYNSGSLEGTPTAGHVERFKQNYFRVPTVNIPVSKKEAKPLVQQVKADEPTGEVPQLVEHPDGGNILSNIAKTISNVFAPKPASQPQVPVPTKPGLSAPTQQAAKVISNVKFAPPPAVNIKKAVQSGGLRIESRPPPPPPRPNIVQQAAKAVQNVGKTVAQAAKSFFSNIFKRKK